MATLYDYATDETGTGPLGVFYPGTPVVHVLDAQGGPLGAALVASGDPEEAARQWYASRYGPSRASQCITGTREADCTLGPECIDCGRPVDGQAARASVSLRWAGEIPTLFPRCIRCDSVIPGSRDFDPAVSLLARRAKAMKMAWDALEGHGDAVTRNELHAALEAWTEALGITILGALGREVINLGQADAEATGWMNFHWHRITTEED